MLTLIAAGPDGLVTFDTTDGVPVLEVVCTRCPWSLSMLAYAPISSSADVVGMAVAVVDQHRTAAHPERVR